MESTEKMTSPNKKALHAGILFSSLKLV